MADLPITVFCHKCFSRFETNLSVADDLSVISIDNCKALCHTCGNWVRIADGEYSFERLAREAVARADANQRAELAAVIEAFDPGDGMNALAAAVSRLDGPWEVLVRVLRSVDFSSLDKGQRYSIVLTMVAILVAVVK